MDISFFQLSYIVIRFCDDGHAQLHPAVKYKSVVILDHFARSLSPNSDVQEFVARSCSLEGFVTQTCWRQIDGVTSCQGRQKLYHFWTTIPSMLIFEQEVSSGHKTPGKFT